MQKQLVPDDVSKFKKAFHEEGITPRTVAAFQDIIKKHYAARARKFPFREESHYSDPYKVIVSEIMLQQTQADRVVEKYLRFIDLFPNFEVLAAASNEDVLRQWIGLGYNRRALALKRIAVMVVNELGGVVPRAPEQLHQFPNIGPNTAASIAAFAFNTPVVFVETNIRTVYIHFFFSGQDTISDEAILALVEKTLDRNNPREWYYALMDYGVMLKKNFKNVHAKQSKAFKQQKPFKGSTRQVRGNILKTLIGETLSVADIVRVLSLKPGTVEPVLLQLEKEGFVKRDGDTISLT